MITNENEDAIIVKFDWAGIVFGGIFHGAKVLIVRRKMAGEVFLQSRLRPIQVRGGVRPQDDGVEQKVQEVWLSLIDGN